jgi:hypothetical protein
MRWISIAVACVLLVVVPSTWPQNKSKAIPRNPPDTNPQYFPKGAFQDSSESGWFQGFKERWYAKHLRSMHEPSLFEASKNNSLVAYRFLWLRTFHSPIAIRLTIRIDGTGTLIGKMTNGKGGYNAGNLTLNESHELTKAQVEGFLGLLRKAAFWSTPSEDGAGGNDGAQWVLEGVENGRYHIVDRWSPEKSDFEQLCLFMFKQSQIRVDPKEIY